MKSGTPNTETTSSADIGSQNVCDIIRTCAEARVSVLKFGNLYVEFSKTDIPEPDFKIPLDQIPVSPQGPVPAITEEDKKTIRENLRREEVTLRDEQISLAVIEDPTLAEELITGEFLGENGEIEDDATGDT